MNRNTESHFSRLPRANIQRSVLDLSSSHTTSLNAGDVIPFYVGEILPGDTFDVTTAKVVRSQTLLTPLMDNMYLDTYWFFVPNRLVWQHWEEFCGENKTGPWTQPVDYVVPSISSPVDSAGNPTTFAVGTLADYMGYPIQTPWKNTDALSPSALPFRAYSLIINHFFRDENFANPLLVPLDDANQVGTNSKPYGSSQDLSACSNGGFPYRANKFHDYFTSALPAAQRGDPVEIPINVPTFAGGTFPVVTGANLNYNVGDSGFPLLTFLTPSFSPTNPKADPNNPAALPLSNKGFLRDISGENSTQFPVYNRSDADYRGIVPANLQTTIPPAENGSGTNVSFSINQFRLAYVYQCYLEAIARSGSRYGEMINQIFGVSNPDSRLQHPEYLGGNRVPVQIQEITNTTQADKDFLGDVGAKSQTSDVNHDFTKSFTEHGILMGLCVVRYDHSYSQGLPRWLTRKHYTDFYNPMFANLGEMPIYKAEIYAGSGTYSVDNPINKPDSTFGYQEAWADYRYCPSRVSAEMRPGVPNSLAFWHLGDYYETEPTISEEWLFEDKSNVDRALAVTSAVSMQFFADIAWTIRATRCMPMYSVPGLEPKF